jgi:uncharacterized tellurite resistance protein B-like protein
MRWVPGGQTIEMHGMTIVHGMIYVGVGTAKEEPSLINPVLPIGRHHDNSAEPLLYWLTYEGMTPTARHRYLEWLADGARAPIDIGYVFLYFYGLERRLLLDQAAAGPEAPALLAEVDRLAAIFGGSKHSFQFYSRGLLDYIQLHYCADEVSEDVPDLTEAPSYELPITFRFGLGRFARDERPLPVAWALRWALADRSIRRRSPVDRCREVFERAFAQVYANRFGEGIRLHHICHRASPLKLTYGAASPALRLGQFTLDWKDIPDVTAVEGPREQLQLLVNEATSLIDSHSRFLGRNPDKVNTLQAHLALPYALWPVILQERLREFRANYVEPMEPITCADLFAQFGRGEPPTPQMVVGLANGLQHVAVGMEPDVLAGARRPRPGDSVVLFPLLGEREFGPRTARFQTASLTVSLSSCLALTDGVASASELQATEERIATWTYLSADQQMRLRAKYRVGLRRPASLTALKKKLSALSQEQRLEVVLAVSHLAKADGVVSTAKVQFLEQLYRVLKLDPQSVYQHLYSTPSNATHIGRPSLCVEGTATNSQKITLDRERISQLQRETELVSALLGDAFDEEESDIAVVAQGSVNFASPSEFAAVPLLPGLSSSHNAFLTLLLTRAEWSRAELEAAAAERQIILDGAMENINDAALDAFGAMLFDGDDPIYVQTELMENAA